MAKIEDPIATLRADDGAEILTDLLQSEIHLMNLDDHCRDGGTVGSASVWKLKVLPFHDEDEEAEATFEVEFTETYHNGCRDIDWKNYFKGQGTAWVDLKTGGVRAGVDAEQVLSPADREGLEGDIDAQIEAFEASQKAEQANAASTSTPGTETNSKKDGGPITNDSQPGAALPF